MSPPNEAPALKEPSEDERSLRTLRLIRDALEDAKQNYDLGFDSETAPSGDLDINFTVGGLLGTVHTKVTTVSSQFTLKVSQTGSAKVPIDALLREIACRAGLHQHAENSLTVNPVRPSRFELSPLENAIAVANAIVMERTPKQEEVVALRLVGGEELDVGSDRIKRA